MYTIQIMYKSDTNGYGNRKRIIMLCIIESETQTAFSSHDIKINAQFTVPAVMDGCDF